MATDPIYDPQAVQSLHIFLSGFALIFGLLWGSFFNVCIYRIPAKKSVVVPGSHCGSCGSAIAWYDNVPAFAWLLLGGKCRNCGEPFSMRYLGIELLSGAVFLLIYLQFGVTVALATHAAFCGLMIVGAFIDIDHFILPDGLTLGGAACAIVAATAFGLQIPAARELETLLRETSMWLEDPKYYELANKLPGWALGLGGSFLGAVLGYGVLWAVALLGRLIFRKEAMGGGDLKLFALVGGYLGVFSVFWVLFISSFLGSIFGISFLILHSIFRKDEIDEVIYSPDQPSPTESPTELSANGPPELQMDNEPTNLAEPEPIVFRIPRRTGRTLRQFPFGPYIAVAAIMLLLFHTDFLRMVQNGIGFTAMGGISTSNTLNEPNANPRFPRFHLPIGRE